MESERLRIFSNISIINKIISCYHCLYSFFYYCHLIQRQHTVLTLSFGWVCGPLMSWGCQQPTAPESAGAASSGYFGGLELALYCSSKLQQVSLAARTNFPFSYLYAKSGIHLHFHFHTVVSYIFLPLDLFKCVPKYVYKPQNPNDANNDTSTICDEQIN